MVTSWILNSISKEIADSLLDVDSAHDAWRDVHVRFNQSNGPRISQIKKHLVALHQGSMDVNTYYTRLKLLWDELRNFQPNPTCHYGGIRLLMVYQQQEYVLQFLMGRNESYAQTRTHILMMDQMPSISKVFELVVQKEAKYN